MNLEYTTGEVAKFCNVQKITAIRWIRRGLLPAHQLPGRGDRRVSREDLIRFMKENQFPLPEELGAGSRKILVVDDDPTINKVLCSMLRHAGFEVEAAMDGFQAGLMLEHLRPALVTLDLSMPGISGFSVLSSIRARKELKTIKVLVVSAMSSQHLNEAVKMGADDFLKKPFLREELLEKITRLLG